MFLRQIKIPISLDLSIYMKQQILRLKHKHSGYWFRNNNFVPLTLILMLWTQSISKTAHNYFKKKHGWRRK